MSRCKKTSSACCLNRKRNVGKTPSWRDQQSFTLVELLVVIMIVVLLGGLLMPALIAARNYARATVARSEVRALANAWQGYWDIYGEWPPNISEMNPDAVKILQGNNDQGYNDLEIQFMTFPDDVRDDDSEGFTDPWGRLYQVDFGTVGDAGQNIGFSTRAYMSNRQRYK